MPAGREREHARLHLDPARRLDADPEIAGIRDHEARRVVRHAGDGHADEHLVVALDERSIETQLHARRGDRARRVLAAGVETGRIETRRVRPRGVRIETGRIETGGVLETRSRVAPRRAPRVEGGILAGTASVAAGDEPGRHEHPTDPGTKRAPRAHLRYLQLVALANQRDLHALSRTLQGAASGFAGRKSRPTGTSTSSNGGIFALAVSSRTPASSHWPSLSESAVSVRASGSRSQ